MNQPKDAPAARQGQYLSFELGGELYAVEILKVQEIRGWAPVRPLPNTPEHVKGVLDLRGVIVPIVDLRIRFGLDPGEYTPTTVIIVLAVHQDDQPLVIGVVVDSVSDVLDVAADEVRKPPRMGGHIDYRYLVGMVNRQEQMVVLLDSDQLLDPEELKDLAAEV
ncbi:purine-binding chemotaxis protein CheW [Magnetovirga frankeli]|uniref:chemotaxis protein CheW n=1 Tax=Magnetovirga frankeli TaxID=947516 RepID=UPI001292E9A4|nr:purine-binding chemotaxis protein CheW [gamma proteobacterium SS-5]